jgi:alkylation response protein AidB-like acyl-CoA dehydrogenase
MSPSALAFTGLDADRADLAAVADDLLATASDQEQAILEAGWAAIAIPEAAGGAGGTLADLAPIAEAVGARLAPTMAGWSSGVAGPVLARAGDREVVPRLAAGAATLAIPVGSPWRVAAGLSVAGGAVSGQLRVLGRADGTAGGAAPGAADIIAVVPVRVDGQEALAVVPTDHGAVTVRVREPVDVTRPVADLELAGLALADATLAIGDDLFADWTRRSGVICALDAAGGARVALQRLLEHAHTRYQFGRPIGSFQAYKHRCARAFIELKLAQSLAFRAAREIDTAEGSRLALAAAVFCANRATYVIGEAIQLYGGMGFTWEVGLHAHLKRARIDEIIAKADGWAARELLKETA